METSIAFAPRACFTPRIAPEGARFVGSTRAALSSPQEHASIRYTLDGTVPTGKSSLYTAPIKITGTCELRARAWLPDGSESEMRRAVFTRLTPRKPDRPGRLKPGVSYRYYETKCEKMPDLSNVDPDDSGVASNFRIDTRKRDDNFVFSFRGFIKVPEDGLYTFYTASDDGSMLYIGGRLVVNNDGLHGTREISGDIALEAGPHAITVLFFQAGGGEALSVSMKGPGMNKKTIPDSFLWHGRQDR